MACADRCAIAFQLAGALLNAQVVEFGEARRAYGRGEPDSALAKLQDLLGRYPAFWRAWDLAAQIAVERNRTAEYRDWLASVSSPYVCYGSAVESAQAKRPREVAEHLKRCFTDLPAF